MKNLLAIAALAAASAACAQSIVVPVTVTNEILTVNQDGKVSKEGFLGTVTDLAQLQAATEIAAAKAETADKVYADTTNLLHDVAQQLVNRNAVVFRRYFMDAFTAAIVIGPDDKCIITGFEKSPDSEQTETGRVKYVVRYGCTADVISLRNIFRINSDLNRQEWTELGDAYVGQVESEPGTYTDPRSQDVYNHLYKVTLSLPQEVAQFVVLNVPYQYADTDGATVLIRGGVKDGLTTTIHDGNLAYGVTGGFVTSVHQTEPNE